MFKDFLVCGLVGGLWGFVVFLEWSGIFLGGYMVLSFKGKNLFYFWYSGSEGWRKGREIVDKDDSGKFFRFYKVYLF